MSGQDSEMKVQNEFLGPFRETVLAKIKAEENLIPQLRRDPKTDRIGLAIVIVLISVSFIAILVQPYGSYIWLLVSFIIVCFAWLLLFLPTTKREKGYWKNRRSLPRVRKGQEASP